MNEVSLRVLCFVVFYFFCRVHSQFQKWNYARGGMLQTREIMIDILQLFLFFKPLFVFIITKKKNNEINGQSLKVWLSTYKSKQKHALTPNSSRTAAWLMAWSLKLWRSTDTVKGSNQTFKIKVADKQFTWLLLTITAFTRCEKKTSAYCVSPT